MGVLDFGWPEDDTDEVDNDAPNDADEHCDSILKEGLSPTHCSVDSLSPMPRVPSVSPLNDKSESLLFLLMASHLLEPLDLRARLARVLIFPPVSMSLSSSRDGGAGFL